MASSHDAWLWQRFLRLLDAAGYAIVKKPELTDKGLPYDRRKGGQ